MWKLLFGLSKNTIFEFKTTLMQTLKPTENELTAIKHVEDWLKENGFVGVSRSSVNNSSFIEANGTIENILVNIVYAVSPGIPEKVDDAEKAKIKMAAESIGRKAYVAYVVLNEDSSLASDINWQRIS